MNEQELQSPANVKFWKALFIFAFLFIGVFILIIKLFNLQILQHDSYKEKAKRQHESKIILSAKRGNIYDCNSKLIATDINTISVAVDPNLLKNKKKICAILSENLNISEKNLLGKINSSKGSFVWLVRGVLAHKVQELKDIDDKGLILVNEKSRRYFYSSTGAQIIGATDIDNRGITGMELGLDSILAGNNGYMIVYRDAIGRLRPSVNLPLIEAVDGNSLKLTLNVDLQRIVEYELQKGVSEADAESGTAIIMEISTGKILALASAPGFDPNNITKETVKNMKIRAITDVYEPGSTFKMITSAIAIQELGIKESDVFDGRLGIARYKGYSIRDVHPLGKVTFKEAIEHSSNIIFADIANSIPDKKLYKYLRDFGFGLKYDFDIPGEVTGMLPKPDQFSGATKRFIGHGYGLSVSALQLIAAYSAIANKGVLMKPYLVEQIIDSRGEISYQATPEKIRQVISEHTSREISRLFTGVVDNGTGKNARITGLKIAGKTGTSKQLVNGSYDNSHYTGSFAGYFPSADPQYAMLIIIDRPQGNYYGGSTAAPVFRNILSSWINIDSSIVGRQNYRINQIETIANDTVIVPDITGLHTTEAEQIINNAGLKFRSGFEPGLIEYQSPVAGMKALKGIEVEIKIRPSSIKKVAYVEEKSFLDLDPERPDLRGFTLRRAIAFLNAKKITVKVHGTGVVRRQVWENIENGLLCHIYCR